MSDNTSSEIVVSLCDWQGRLIWTSSSHPCCEIGTVLWHHALEEDQEAVKTAISRVATLREPQIYEASNDAGAHYQVSLWPLNTPDIAVCMLSLPIPGELALLTARERDCLKLLSRGCAAGAIAAELDVSVSTIHTHLRRAREKLNLSTVESLISFAARYCFRPTAHPIECAKDTVRTT